MRGAEKRKLLITACSLLLCFTTLISASFAWISLATAPEITGIQTQVGANGSLEIALLQKETYLDPSGIRTTVGDSQVAQDALRSNLAWGNVIDLSDPAYGLDHIAIMPSRLNVAENGEGGGVVRSGLLSTVEFGLDGRVGRMNSESAAAVYTESGFYFDSENQSYGVRGIGPVPLLSPQQSALTNAQSLVSAYISAALGITESAWSANGEELLDIFFRHYLLNAASFGEADVSVLKDAVTKMQSAYDYVDAALRQGIIGYAASVVTDPETFRTLRDNVENPMLPLSMLLQALPGTLPSGFSQWITDMDASRMQLRQALIRCNAMRGRTVTWEEINPVLDVLINGRKAYLGDYRLATAEAFAEMDSDTVLLLSPESGVMSEIADYVGNYQVIFDYAQLTGIEARSASKISTPYLYQVKKVLQECKVEDNDGAPIQQNLEDIYGFAIDMAFRSNADTQLLLQTEAAARIDDGNQVPQTFGSGSYMSLSSEQLDAEQIIRLMDAIRIGFLDNQNNLLAVAKMNTLNFEETENGIRAPMYLYSYEIGSGGVLLMGERRKDDAVITDMVDGNVLVMTAVVWLDGDYVDNSLASIRGRSVQGSLNLQFASSVNLIPAQQTVEQPD